MTQNYYFRLHYQHQAPLTDTRMILSMLLTSNQPTPSALLATPYLLSLRLQSLQPKSQIPLLSSYILFHTSVVTHFHQKTFLVPKVEFSTLFTYLTYSNDTSYIRHAPRRIQTWHTQPGYHGTGQYLKVDTPTTEWEGGVKTMRFQLGLQCPLSYVYSSFWFPRTKHLSLPNPPCLLLGHACSALS